MAEHRSQRSLSLRTRIILMTTGTLFVAMMIGSYLERQLVSQNIVRQKLVTVEILTTSIVHDITYNRARGDESGPQVIEKYMTYYRIIRDMTLYDSKLVVTAAADPKRVGTNAQDAEVRAAILEARPSVRVSRPSLSDFRIRSIAPLLQGSRIIGAVVVDVSMQDLRQTMAAMDVRLAALMAAKLVLVAVGLFLLLRGSILLRLRRLMLVTQEIRTGHYDARIDDRTGDEIGSLAQALDQMVAELQDSRRQIEDYNKHLEERVQEATVELARTYEDLKSAQGQLVLNEKMASLGVLIAGVAHEINTPVGAILNVSRNLLKELESLPQDLVALREKADLPMALVVECLQELLLSSCRPQAPLSYKAQRSVEALMMEHGVPDARRRAATLCKISLTDEEKIRRYIVCFRDDAFFALAESCTSIAQAAMIATASSQKIAEIVKALKYYAYSDKDRVDLIQINDSITTALVLLRNHFKHGVTVTADLAPDLPPIQCSSDIHQAWTNLLTNAYDAVTTSNGDEKGEIHVTTRRKDEAIAVSITDSGIGIPKENMARIFDPFYTTKDIGKGTGLGLGIVSGIVKKHAGTIRVESEPGRTMFEIELPIGPTQTAAELEASPAPAADSKAA